MLSIVDHALSSLQASISCVRCGYNLRTLATDTRCPECSTPVESSLNANLLRYADPSWTGMLAAALGLMTISLALQFGFYVILLLLARLNLFPALAPAWDYFNYLQHIHLVAGPLFWVGVFLAGHPDRSTIARTRYASFRRAMRFTALLTLLRTILQEGTVQEASILQLSLFEKPIGQLIELLAIIFAFLYLLQIARRTGSVRLMRHTIIGLVGLILVYCWAIVRDIFVPEAQDEPWSFYVGWAFSGILLYNAYVFFLFRRTLKKSAHFARQYWHFCSPIPRPDPVF